MLGKDALEKARKTGMKVAKNKAMMDTTLQTITTTLSVMLMPALFFCLVPVLIIAMMARMRAGMEHVRKMR